MSKLLILLSISLIISLSGCSTDNNESVSFFNDSLIQSSETSSSLSESSSVSSEETTSSEDSSKEDESSESTTSSEPHVHNFTGDYIDDGEQHYQSCSCGEKEYNNHSYGNAISKDDSIHTYLCNECHHEKNESHSLNDNYTYDADVGSCYLECLICHYHHHEDCDNQYSTIDDSKHQLICSKCGNIKEETHHWNEGIIITYATFDDYTMKMIKGTKRVTCLDCGQEAIIEHSQTHPL